MRRLQTIVLFVVLASMVIVGCSSDDSGDSPDSTTTLTPMSDPATTTTATDWLMQVEFDGNWCTVNGPTDIPNGTVVPIVFTNSSDLLVDFAVARLSDHGIGGAPAPYGDYDELQRATGGVIWDTTNVWDATYEVRPDRPAEWLWNDLLWFDRDSAIVLAPQLAENQTLKFYRLAYPADEHLVYVSGPGEFDTQLSLTPEGYWFCAPIHVTTSDP